MWTVIYFDDSENYLIFFHLLANSCVNDYKFQYKYEKAMVLKYTILLIFYFIKVKSVADNDLI